MTLKTNLLRSDELAFTYPLSHRTSAIAVFGSLVKLWRKDREAAEAVLLHEIAHCCQGDVLIVGAGSLFVTLINLWLPLVAGLLILPALVVWSVDALLPLVASGEAYVQSGLAHKVGHFFSQFLPGLLLTASGVGFWGASLLILPLMGTWYVELNADRFVVHAQGAPAGLAWSLLYLNRPLSGWRRMLSRISHPPTGLRRWLVQRHPRRAALVILLLSFPLAYGLKLLLLLGWAGTVFAVSPPSAGAAQTLREMSGLYVRNLLPVALGMVGLLSLWPVLGGFWTRVVAPDAAGGCRPVDTPAALVSALAIAGGYVLLRAWM